MRVKGARVIVTGASAGIGRDTALLLARKGALVWAAARSEDALASLAASASGITPVVCDVSSADDRAALVSAVGDVDVLVNNAGVGWTGLVEDMPFDQVRALFELNVLGLIDLSQRVLPGMLERRRGAIINVGSLAGMVSTPPLSVYSATKFAVQGFTDGLRRELYGRGVWCTNVAPGPVKTHFSARASREDVTEVGSALSLNPGVPASFVSRAVLRSIQVGWLPGYGTVSVPRLGGLARLGAAPVLRLTVDGAAFVSRKAGARERTP